MKEALIGFIGTILGVILTLVYQWFTFKIQRKDQFRLAALDKRLEKHQEAYTLWRELISVIYDEKELLTIIFKCQDWWFKNCLYLQPEARRAFWDSFQFIFPDNPKDQFKLKES
jgi:ABC-type lipoprotein release transport system permease subunit